LSEAAQSEGGGNQFLPIWRNEPMEWWQWLLIVALIGLIGFMWWKKKNAGS
jgi:hypothetical protein